MSVMSTLPPVWLKSHEYQNVTATVPRRKPTKKGGCKPPSSRKRMGTCQPVTSTPSIRVATSGERVLCSPGRANPRQPGSSPSAPSPGLTRRTANTIRTVVTELNWSSEGALAPRATLSPAVSRITPSGSPIAITYQYHLMRQRIIREPSSRSPAHPWVRGITMRAAMNGPAGMNLTLSIGKNPHEIAYARTKNVMSGCRFTTLKRLDII
jgi:hypothetical protein